MEAYSWVYLYFSHIFDFVPSFPIAKLATRRSEMNQMGLISRSAAPCWGGMLLKIPKKKLTFLTEKTQWVRSPTVEPPGPFELGGPRGSQSPSVKRKGEVGG